MNRNELIKQIKKKRTFLCVGLDPDLKKIPSHLLIKEDPIFEFNREIIDATADYCVAFKPNTDDMREAPSLVLISELIRCGASVVAYDPIAMDEAKRVLGPSSSLKYGASPMEILDGADALAIVTEWKEFRSPDFDEIARRLKQRVIFDGRNLYEPAEVRRHGLEYQAIGRPVQDAA